MSRRRLTTILAILAIPLLLADAAGADCASQSTSVGQFTPGRWQAHAFDTFEDDDRIGVMQGARELRFDVEFDERGVVTDGTFAHVTWGANVAFDSSMGSEASWGVGGEISGSVGLLRVDGTFSMDMVIAQTWRDEISGRSGVGYERGRTGEREVSFQFSPDAGDCNVVVGTVEGNGMGGPMGWIAVRTSANPKVSDTYERMFTLAEESWQVRRNGEVDLDEVYALAHDLIAVNQALAALQHCDGVARSSGGRSQFQWFAASVLEELLFHVVTNAQGYSTTDLIHVITQGLQAAGIQTSRCDGTYEDPYGIVARFDQELERRLRLVWERGDEHGLALIATTAYQFGLAQTLGTLAQIGVEL